MPRSRSTTLASSSVDPGLTEAATRIIHKLLSPFEGALALRLWNDVTHSFGQRVGQGAPSFTLTLVQFSRVMRRLSASITSGRMSSASTRPLAPTRLARRTV